MWSPLLRACVIFNACPTAHNPFSLSFWIWGQGSEATAHRMLPPLVGVPEVPLHRENDPAPKTKPKSCSEAMDETRSHFLRTPGLPISSKNMFLQQSGFSSRFKFALGGGSWRLVGSTPKFYPPVSMGFLDNRHPRR